jgi:hypothetical protein
MQCDKAPVKNGILPMMLTSNFGFIFLLSICLLGCKAITPNDAHRRSESKNGAFSNRPPLEISEEVLFQEILTRMLEPFILAGEDTSRLLQGLAEWASRHSEDEIVTKTRALPVRKRNAVLSFAELCSVKFPDEAKALKGSEVFPAARLTLQDRQAN